MDVGQSDKTKTIITKQIIPNPDDNVPSFFMDVKIEKIKTQPSRHHSNVPKKKTDNLEMKK